MKIKQFLRDVFYAPRQFTTFAVPDSCACVRVRYDEDSVPAVVLSEDADSEEFVYLDASELRKVAKLFTRLADKLDAEHG